MSSFQSSRSSGSWRDACKRPGPSASYSFATAKRDRDPRHHLPPPPPPLHPPVHRPSAPSDRDEQQNGSNELRGHYRTDRSRMDRSRMDRSRMDRSRMDRSRVGDRGFSPESTARQFQFVRQDPKVIMSLWNQHKLVIAQCEASVASSHNEMATHFGWCSHSDVDDLTRAEDQSIINNVRLDVSDKTMKAFHLEADYTFAPFDDDARRNTVMQICAWNDSDPEKSLVSGYLVLRSAINMNHHAPPSRSDGSSSSRMSDSASDVEMPVLLHALIHNREETISKAIAKIPGMHDSVMALYRLFNHSNESTFEILPDGQMDYVLGGCGDRFVGVKTQRTRGTLAGSDLNEASDVVVHKTTVSLHESVSDRCFISESLSIVNNLNKESPVVNVVVTNVRCRANSDSAAKPVAASAGSDTFSAMHVMESNCETTTRFAVPPTAPPAKTGSGVQVARIPTTVAFVFGPGDNCDADIVGESCNNQLSRNKNGRSNVGSSLMSAFACFRSIQTSSTHDGAVTKQVAAAIGTDKERGVFCLVDEPGLRVFRVPTRDGDVAMVMSSVRLTADQDCRPQFRHASSGMSEAFSGPQREQGASALELPALSFDRARQRLQRTVLKDGGEEGKLDAPLKDAPLKNAPLTNLVPPPTRAPAAGRSVTPGTARPGTTHPGIEIAKSRSASAPRLSNTKNSVFYDMDYLFDDAQRMVNSLVQFID